MYCPRCGEILNNDARFCNRCGLQLYEGLSTEEVYQNTNAKPRKNHSVLLSAIVKVIIISVIVCVVAWLFLDTSGGISSEDDRYIDFVKNGSPEAYPDITYGEAFSNFFSNCQWQYFKGDNDTDVVEFSGDCMYRDAEATVTLQFILDVDEGTFEAGYLAFNDVPQVVLVEYALITTVFDAYQ